MTFLRFIFVILLCIPVAYVALRLITSLIDKTVYEARHPGQPEPAPGRRRYDSGSYDEIAEDIAERAEARRAEREARSSRKSGRKRGGRKNR